MQAQDYVWPINGVLLLALALSGYIRYRLYQGRLFGERSRRDARRITLALAVVQDGLITAGVCLTGFYDSHFFIFYYPSLLGFSLASERLGSSLRVSLAYTSLVGLVYSGLCWVVPQVSGEPLVIKVLPLLAGLLERWLVLYLVVVIGWLVVHRERERRLAAVAAEQRMAEENERLRLSLHKQRENAQLIGLANDRAAGQLAALAQELVSLAGEIGVGSAEITVATEEITGRAMTYVEHVAAISQVTDQIVAAAHNLAARTGPTGVASEQAQRAVTKATEAVEALSQRSQTIGDLATAVRRVADQTNLLAFNATIEAIQAGQKGQRFAVVAGEVRQVAEQAILLAREIDELSAEVQRGARRVLSAMSEIAEMVDQAVDLVKVTSEASHSQQTSADVMARSVDTLESVSRQNAVDVRAVVSSVQQQQAALQRIEALSRELANSAGNLRSLTDSAGGQSVDSLPVDG